jgi:hypothetical protein
VIAGESTLEASEQRATIPARNGAKRKPENRTEKEAGMISSAQSRKPLDGMPRSTHLPLRQVEAVHRRKRSTVRSSGTKLEGARFPARFDVRQARARLDGDSAAREQDQP